MHLNQYTYILQEKKIKGHTSMKGCSSLKISASYTDESFSLHHNRTLIICSVQNINNSMLVICEISSKTEQNNVHSTHSENEVIWQITYIYLFSAVCQLITLKSATLNKSRSVTNTAVMFYPDFIQFHFQFATFNLSMSSKSDAAT